jgi:DNA (cytosine-5)-methyltransferase 1
VVKIPLFELARWIIWGGEIMPTVVDLFCGVGGLTYGLHLAGLNVVAGIDVDKSCQYAYEHNNSDSQFIQADISKLRPEDVKVLYPATGVRVLVGCAPCQPFSKYTKRYRKGEQNGGRNNDSWQCDNKWKLLYSFADIIRHVLPDIISMENVPELANEQVFIDFYETLIELGYNVSYSLVYCPEYGVPQNRRRLVLLASMWGKMRFIEPKYTPDKYQTVKDAIGSLPEIASGKQDKDDPLHCAAKLNSINLRRIRQSKQGGTWRDWSDDLRLSCHKKESGRTYASIYGRMYWDKPAPTITTQFYGYGNGRFGHPEQDRALTLREGAMLQSFPKDYEFIEPGAMFNRHDVGIHIGNAVPVLLGKAIGETINAHLMEVRDNG